MKYQVFKSKSIINLKNKHNLLIKFYIFAQTSLFI